jgi:class 3 adenylate cyclase
VQIKVKALRQMGQTAQMNLTVAGQPANVAPQLANIAANAGEAVITLKVAANAPEVTQNVIITGNMNNNIQVAPAFTLTIVP